MKKCLCVVMIWAFYALPGAVRAEEENESVDATTTMEEIVVTATKTEEKRKNIPNAVIVKDKPDINESPATGLGELLANELGLDWRTQGNFGGAAQEIQIRGMRGNATQILVNGITINSPSLGLADVGKISLNNIDRVEVVKGSGSLLYGSGAMGGTVYIITKRPERDKIALNLQAGYGSEGTYRVAAEQGMFISEDFGYYLTTALSETDGFRDNGDLDHKDVSLKFVFDKGDALDISLYGDYIDRDFGRPGVKPPRGTQAFFVGSTKVYDKGSASLLDRGGDEDGHLALEVKSKPVSWLDIHFLSDYTNMENYNYLRYVSMDFAGNLNLPGSKTWTTNEVLGFEGDVEIRPFDGTNILLGAEYNDFDWESKGVDLDEN
ncbi:MAG: TonB-dependent receptor plug domain-containing protein, partial [Desulfobacterales bacterium]|nr:TonB-dependent receptor plug domain-containing protein [Desulfobacterales bacterium]